MFKSILVDVDARAAVHPALVRATELAKHCGARLKIVDVLGIPTDARHPLREAVEQELVDTCRHRLTEFARGAGDVPTDVDVLRGRPAVALVHEVLRAGHDLLVRSHARDLARPMPKGFGAVDMQLFRKCPCPVWAVAPGSRAAPATILAAVHGTPHGEGGHQLNAKIVELALAMSQFQGAQLMLLQAWTAFGEEVARCHYKADELAEYVQAAENVARDNLDRVVTAFGDRLAGAQLELRKGFAEEVIPQIVVSKGIDLVVMGTVARTGIAGLLMGNTAERLLQRLVCSVLAVKPDGFVSPITLETPSWDS